MEKAYVWDENFTAHHDDLTGLALIFPGKTLVERNSICSANIKKPLNMAPKCFRMG